MKTKSKMIWIAALATLFSAPASGATPTAVSKTVELVEIDSFLPLWVVVASIFATIGLICFSMKLDTAKAVWTNILAFLVSLFAFGASFVTGSEQAYTLQTTATAQSTKDFIAPMNTGYLGIDNPLNNLDYSLTTIDGTTTADTVMQLILYENTGLLIFTAAVSIFTLVILVYSILQMIHDTAQNLDNETGL